MRALAVWTLGEGAAAPPYASARHRFKDTGVHATRMLFMFTPGGEEGVFAYGDEAQPGHPPPAWPLERFSTPEILRFNEEHGVVILPERD